MPSGEHAARLSLNQFAVQVRELRSALKAEAKRVAERDHEIVRLKGLARWRQMNVDGLVLVFGGSVGLLAGFVFFG